MPREIKFNQSPLDSQDRQRKPGKPVEFEKQFNDDKASTYYMCMDESAMEDGGIDMGDVLLVDKNAKPVSGRVIVALLNGEILVRRLEKTFNKIRLVPDSNNLAAIEVDLNSCEFNILGTVLYVLKPV